MFYNSTKVLLYMIICHMAIAFIPSFSNGQSLEDGLKDLATQISNGMSETQKQKIAVIEFSDLDGKISELGKFLSEELITRLFLTRRFNVVERQLLNKVLAEHKLNVSGIVDQSTAKELGKLLGVDAICSGTVTDLVTTIKINARLISSETGSVFAVASTQVQEDDIVRKLMGKGTYVAERTQQSATALPGTVIYYEDFSKVAEGQLPKGWIGGETLGVSRSKRFQNKNVLIPIKATGPHNFIIPNLNFPEDFKLELDIMILEFMYSPMVFGVGDLIFGLEESWRDSKSWLDEAQFRFSIGGDKKDPNYFPYNEIIHITLEKNKNVFKLYLNGNQVSLVRKSNFSKPTLIRFAYGNKNVKDKAGFGLYRIVISAL